MREGVGGKEGVGGRDRGCHSLSGATLFIWEVGVCLKSEGYLQGTPRAWPHLSGEISPDFWDLKDASLDKEVAEASLVLAEGQLDLTRGWEAAGRQDTAWAECLLLGRICFHKT